MKLLSILVTCALLAPAAPVLAKADAAPGQPGTRALYLNLIQQARSDGRSRAALAYLDDYDRTYPGDVEAKVVRINCLLDLREFDAAEAVMSQVRSAGLTGTLAGQVQAVQGHVLAARDRWGDAVPFYTAAVRADPTSPWLRNALGYALLRDRQLDRAVETLRDARDLSPDALIIRNNLWLAYALSGRDQLLAHALAALPDHDEGLALGKRIEVEAARLRRMPVGTPAAAAPAPAVTPTVIVVPAAVTPVVTVPVLTTPILITSAQKES